MKHARQLFWRTVLLILLVTQSREAMAQVTLIDWDGRWKYHAEGIALPPEWIGVEYGDFFWGEGAAALGYPASEGLPIGIVRTALTQVFGNYTTYYRHQFVYEEDTAEVTLNAFAIVDDGAVFYLNGVEVARIAMPEGPVMHVMAATRAMEASTTGIEAIDIPAGLLVRGTNVLAVEVHQGSNFSSDSIFALQLLAIRLSPEVVLLEEPADTTVAEGDEARFEVTAEGMGIQYQWYRAVPGGPVSIPGANTAILAIPVTSRTDDGEYFVVISNMVSEARSINVRLTVILDLSPPGILLADGAPDDASRLTISFSEPLEEASAIDPGNYVLTNNLGGGLTILSLSLSNLTNVVFMTEPREPDGNYAVIVAGVRDRAGNPIQGVQLVPVSTVETLIPFDAFWDYYDPVFGLDPIELSDSGWKTEVDYDFGTEYWGHGRAALVRSSLPVTLPVEQNSTLLQTRYLRANIRTVFDYSRSRSGLVLEMTHLVDDGAVFHLNGAEVARFNMPAGDVMTNTPAASEVVEAQMLTVSIPPELIRPGPNLLAVELHQVRRLDHDKVFALELKARSDSSLTGPPIISSPPQNQTVAEHGEARFDFRWLGGGEIQWYADGIEIAGATNAVLKFSSVTPHLNGMRISARVAGSGVTVLTEEAVLTVIRDQTVPDLISAINRAEGLTLLFSEPLDDASAMDMANYAVTNCQLGAREIVSVTRASPESVLLKLSVPLEAGDFVLVNGIGDRSEIPNFRSEPLGFSIGYAGGVMPLDQVWRYDDSGEDLGTAWKEPLFDDSSWPSGRGLLGWETTSPPDPILTPLAMGHPTYYFRTEFDLPFLPLEGDLCLEHYVDDGAVIYLNGVEVYRVRLLPGQDYFSFGEEIANTGLEGCFALPQGSIVTGTNVLAVEVHQASPFSSDLLFGARLSLLERASVRLRPEATPPELGIELLAGGRVRIAWPEVIDSYVVEQGVSPEGPWARLVDVEPPGVGFVERPAFGSRRFYRLTGPPLSNLCWIPAE